MNDTKTRNWLLFIHQLPPKPAYLRVKVGRRLQRLGAVMIKNSVYALPQGDSAYEDLQWVLREILQDDGEASLCEARFIDGLSDEQIQALFDKARNSDYAEIAEETKSVAGGLPESGVLDEGARSHLEAGLARLKKRFLEVSAVDFFGAPGREVVAGLIGGLEARLRPALDPADEMITAGSHDLYRARTWVTRKGIHVDRMASSWLIHRFIDPEARFKFVPAKDYRPEPGELRFDMFEAEFTHEGDRCAFEVLLGRFGLNDPGLHAIAEIVHDIDLKDAKFGRQDALGLERLVAGISLAHKDDEVRLVRSRDVFDDLYEYFKRKQ